MGFSPRWQAHAVSATSDGHFFVIDTATGKQVTKVPTGSFPAPERLPPDGKYIYNTSIGTFLCLMPLNGIKGKSR